MKKKWKVIVSTAILAAAFTGFASQTEAAQPHSSYWYPDSLLKWDPKQDKDADFNKGTVKLQKRTKGFNQVNPNALADPKVVALAAMNPSTSGTPSQGSDKFNIYAFNNWQYIDKLVMWGDLPAKVSSFLPVRTSSTLPIKMAFLFLEPFFCRKPSMAVRSPG